MLENEDIYIQLNDSFKKIKQEDCMMNPRILQKDSTFEIEGRPYILDYIFSSLVPFNYNFCRQMLLEIIRIEALVLSTTTFQIYSLVLPLSVFMKLLFLSFICILKSFVSTFLIWLQPSLEDIFLFSHRCYYFYYAEENVHCSHPELPKQPLTEY